MAIENPAELREVVCGAQGARREEADPVPRRALPQLHAPGNNRLDSFENIVATGKVGVLFLIPGVER